VQADGRARLLERLCDHDDILLVVFGQENLDGISPGPVIHARPFFRECDGHQLGITVTSR
jgi:hypothetical protein